MAGSGLPFSLTCWIAHHPPVRIMAIIITPNVHFFALRMSALCNKNSDNSETGSQAIVTISAILSIASQGITKS